MIRQSAAHAADACVDERHAEHKCRLFGLGLQALARPLFPEGLPQSRRFERYAEVFDTAELNNSFYRLPRHETFAKWSDNEIGRHAIDDARALKSMFD